MGIFATLASIWKKFQYFFYQKKVNTAVDEVATAQTDEEDIHALQDIDDASYGPKVSAEPSPAVQPPGDPAPPSPPDTPHGPVVG